VKRSILALPALWISLGVAVWAQDEEPIAAKLTRAKEAYAAAEETFRKGVLERLTAEEARATKAGKKAAVDQVIADREAFEASGTLPKSLKLTDLQAQRARARLDLTNAYKRAISDFTRKRMRVEADAAEREMAEFQSSVAGDQLKPGTVWRGQKRYLKGGPPGLHPFELRVINRNADTFKGIIIEEDMSHDIAGAVQGNKIEWKITRVRSGVYPGQPQSGTIEDDVLKLHFARRDGLGGMAVEAEGSVKLQKKK